MPAPSSPRASAASVAAARTSTADLRLTAHPWEAACRGDLLWAPYLAILLRQTNSIIFWICIHCTPRCRSEQGRDSYRKMMNKYIGSDVTSLITLPIIIFEPLSMFQKMAEKQ